MTEAYAALPPLEWLVSRQINHLSASPCTAGEHLFFGENLSSNLFYIIIGSPEGNTVSLFLPCIPNARGREALRLGKIDARGRSCPQPVMMTKVHVEKGETEIEVFLDNAISASNVQRYLEKNGYSVRIFDEEGSIIIRASVRSEVSLSTEVPPSPSGDSSV